MALLFVFCLIDPNSIFHLAGHKKYFFLLYFLHLSCPSLCFHVAEGFAHFTSRFCYDYSYTGSSRPSTRGDRPKPASLRKKRRQKKSHQELLHHYKLHRRRQTAWKKTKKQTPAIHIQVNSENWSTQVCLQVLEKHKISLYERKFALRSFYFLLDFENGLCALWYTTVSHCLSF